MTDRELLLDCLQRLNQTDLNYMLTGSMASNAWGVPRTTHDLNFVVQLPPREVPHLVNMFGGDYHIDELAVRAAYQAPYQFNVIHVPSALKIDFWMLRNTPLEQSMFARRVRDHWFGQPLWLATAEDVILHKLYWHSLTPSERQLSDIGGVVEVQKDRLDEAYLRRWAAELGLTPILEDALAGKFRPKQT